MSKGSKRRPTNSKQFNKNYDSIKWSDKPIWTPKEQKRAERKSAYVWDDIKPYQAAAGDMVGKEISSRSKHREFLRRNSLIEVGNEKDYFFKHGGKTPDNPTKDWGRDD